MLKTKVLFLVFLSFFACILAMGGGKSNQGADFGGLNVGMGRQQQFRSQYGAEESRKYRSNLYSDDDVYGYDSMYPGGEASYINFKSKDARSRRGPEFAKVSRAYSGRQEARGGRGGFDQMNQMGPKW